MRRPRLITIVLIAAIVLLLSASYPTFIKGVPSGHVGGAAGLLLSGWAYPNLVVEIDSEVPISDSTISSLKDFIFRYSDKPFVSIETSFIESGQTTFTIADIREVESQNRGSSQISFLTISVYILVLNGMYQSGVTGVSYGPTSFAVFLSEQANEVVHITMAHEMAHLWGLNCIRFEEPAGEDWKCDGNGHSLNSNSLMAPRLKLDSPNVVNLELTDSELRQLAYIKANA